MALASRGIGAAGGGIGMSVPGGVPQTFNPSDPNSSSSQQGTRPQDWADIYASIGLGGIGANRPSGGGSGPGGMEGELLKTGLYGGSSTPHANNESYTWNTSGGGSGGAGGSRGWAGSGSSGSRVASSSRGVAAAGGGSLGLRGGAASSVSGSGGAGVVDASGGSSAPSMMMLGGGASSGGDWAGDASIQTDPAASASSSMTAMMQADPEPPLGFQGSGVGSLRQGIGIRQPPSMAALLTRGRPY